MRTAFIETLCELAADDDRVWLLTGDLGYSVLERFADRFPDRYVNVGIAEQNMTGIAAGLAASGKIVFTYSIANFPTLRCLEQIRNDVCYHNVNVKVVSVGSGLSYASLGYSHYGVEDLTVLRTLPNITVLTPGDPIEAQLVTRAAARHSGPCYLRLGKSGESNIHEDVPTLVIGKAVTVREGRDLVVLATGTILKNVVHAVDDLAEHGITAMVLSFPTLVPFDEDAVVAAGQRTGRVVTVEEHGPGALADLAAEALLRRGVPVQFLPLRLPHVSSFVAGTHVELLDRYGLSAMRIRDTISLFLAERSL